MALRKNSAGAVILGITTALIVAAICGALVMLDIHPQRSGSLAAYFGITIVVGVVAVVGEAIAGQLLRRDRVTDPLATRVGRLALVLLSAAFLAGLIYLLASGV